MRECENCHNLIPEGMKICPHCSGLPPTLFPHFFVYLALTCVAIGAAVYFRPFLDGPASGQVVNGVLWAAFTIFVFFAIIFTCVCVIVARDYSHRRFKGKLTKAERIRFINMKQHIESGRHFYDKRNGEYKTLSVVFDESKPSADSNGVNDSGLSSHNPFG